MNFFDNQTTDAISVVKRISEIGTARPYVVQVSGTLDGATLTMEVRCGANQPFAALNDFTGVPDLVKAVTLVNGMDVRFQITGAGASTDLTVDLLGWGGFTNG